MSFNFLSSGDRDPHRTPRRATTARAGAIVGTAGLVVALAATGSLAMAVLDADSSAVQITQTADRLERAVADTGGASAPSDAVPNETRYLACMHAVGGTADTLERWADRCAAIAAAAGSRDQCLREIGGTPDARERWSDECRRRVGP